MIADMKPYPAMKDSEINWLGEVPRHWDIKPNRALFNEIKDKNHPDEQMLSVTIKNGIIKQERLLEDTSKKDSSNLDRSSYKLVQSGDIAYNKMRAWQGAIGLSEDQGIVSPAYIVQRPQPGNEPRYFHHLFRTPAFAKEAEKWSYGITSDMWSLRPEHFKLIKLCIPTLQEQISIVRFLNYINHRIQRYINAKKKLITLLEEYKQAIINQAVTKGLNPYVNMKPSGIEWLGEIPDHWDLRPLKRLTFIQSGLTLGKSYIGRDIEEYPYLRVANVQAGHLDLSHIKTISVPEKEAIAYELRVGDVLMTEGGDPDKLGRGCMWKGEVSPCLHQNHVYAVRPDSTVLLPDFLALQLRSRHAKTYFLVTSKQTTNLAATNKTTIGKYSVLLPDVSEQARIVDAVRQRCMRLNQLAYHATKELDLFTEYRTRLISDVVTGKVDVREIAAQLPEEQDKEDLKEDLFEHTQTIGDV